MIFFSMTGMPQSVVKVRAFVRGQRVRARSYRSDVADIVHQESNQRNVKIMI